MARERGYAPPPPKYGSDHPYRGRGGDAAVDYYQLLMEPESTALLVIDMQNVFVREGAPLAAPDGLEIVPPINDLIAFFREIGQPIIWTAWAHRANAANAGRSLAFWGGLAPVDPDGDLAAIHPEMDYRDDEIMIVKPKYSAFWATDLEAILSSHGIESLVLTGISTDVCVGQTMIEAYHRDYNCAVVRDGTATNTPFQEETLWIHENFWGRVLTASEVKDELAALSSSPKAS
jgi:ureidoacrylate peracid hydrolase